MQLIILLKARRECPDLVATTSGSTPQPGSSSWPGHKSWKAAQLLLRKPALSQCSASEDMATSWCGLLALACGVVSAARRAHHRVRPLIKLKSSSGSKDSRSMPRLRRSRSSFCTLRALHCPSKVCLPPSCWLSGFSCAQYGKPSPSNCCAGGHDQGNGPAWHSSSTPRQAHRMMQGMTTEVQNGGGEVCIRDTASGEVH